MKDGSGDLDFGQSNDAEETTDSGSLDDSSSTDGQRNQDRSRSSETSANQTPEQSTSQSVSTNEPESKDHKYPYFVRRSKVLDERDERIEAHLRAEVTQQESDFRSDLADALDTNDDIPKSDAREFALLFAFENPEGVAELMREEGFGELD